MPLYEFKCNKCATVFEELVTGVQKMGYECPKCHSSDTGKIMSAPGGFNMGGKDYASQCASAPMCPSAGGGCCGGSCMGH